MWRSSKEEWEMRKSYLIRSLFEDLPILSPINESLEPTPLSPNYLIYRPESPLPDLIIEKEPQKYLQDESEEFYDQLAKEMRRLYKRDFLKMDHDSTSRDSTGLGSEYENSTPTGILDTHSKSLEPNKYIQGVDRKAYSYTGQINEEETRSISTYTDTTESEDSVRHEQVITKVDVHSAVVKMSKQLLHERLHTSKVRQVTSQSNSTTITDTSSSYMGCDQSDDSRAADMETGQEVVKELGKTIEAVEDNSPECQDENDQYTPEIMRRRQTIFSEESLPYHELPIWESYEKEVSNNVEIETANDVDSDLDVADKSFSDFNMLCTMTSTPKSLKRVVSQRSMIKRYRKRLVSYSSSSNGSKTSRRQVGLQTSFSDDEPSSKNFWCNLFVGRPMAYNICSCSNHVCS